MGEPMLVEFLSDADVPCPGCDYNLRGLTSARCPECNEALELRVTLADPGLAGFLMALVPSACGLGFCSLLFVLGTFRGVPRGELSNVAFGVVATGILLAGLVAGRRRFTRLGVKGRAAVILMSWSVAAFAVVLIVLTEL